MRFPIGLKAPEEIDKSALRSGGKEHCIRMHVPNGSRSEHVGHDFNLSVIAAKQRIRPVGHRRRGTPPVIGRISDNVLLLDPRSVLPEEDEVILQALRDLAASSEQTQ